MQTVIRRCLRLKPTLARDLNDNAIAKKPGDYFHLSPGMLYSVGASLRNDYLKIEPLAIVKCRQRSNLVHQPARILDARQVGRNNRSQNPALVAGVRGTRRIAHPPTSSIRGRGIGRRLSDSHTSTVESRREFRLHPTQRPVFYSFQRLES